MSQTVRLKNVRLSFPDLFEAKEFKPGDKKPRYNASFLVEPGSDNDKAIEAAIVAAMKEKFLTKADQKLKDFRGQSNKDCYLDGSTKEYDGYEGMKVLSSHRRASDGPVGVYDKVGTYNEEKKKVVPNVLKADSGKPYAGCYVNAVVEIYAQDGEFPGIRAGLQSVQYEREGDAFSGSKPPTAEDFDAVDAGVDADDIV